MLRCFEAVVRFGGFPASSGGCRWQLEGLLGAIITVFEGEFNIAHKGKHFSGNPTPLQNRGGHAQEPVLVVRQRGTN